MTGDKLALAKQTEDAFNRRVDALVWNILDFRGDRIWRFRVYFDRAGALTAAGISE
jgi:hypothetical protein